MFNFPKPLKNPSALAILLRCLVIRLHQSGHNPISSSASSIYIKCPASSDIANPSLKESNHAVTSAVLPFSVLLNASFSRSDVFPSKSSLITSSPIPHFSAIGMRSRNLSGTFSGEILIFGLFSAVRLYFFLNSLAGAISPSLGLLFFEMIARIIKNKIIRIAINIMIFISLHTT